jgi:hypothetical protein
MKCLIIGKEKSIKRIHIKGNNLGIDPINELYILTKIHMEKTP